MDVLWWLMAIFLFCFIIYFTNLILTLLGGEDRYDSEELKNMKDKMKKIKDRVKDETRQ